MKLPGNTISIINLTFLLKNIYIIIQLSIKQLKLNGHIKEELS